MLGDSARWGRWSGDRSPSEERRPAAAPSQLLVETDRSCSDSELAGDLAASAEAAAGGARPRTRTYSLTRLHCSVLLEPGGSPTEAATLPRVRVPITIIGEGLHAVDEPASDGKQKRKKSFKRFLSVENLRKSVRKSRERIQGMDETLRRRARKTLRRMRADKKGAVEGEVASSSPTSDLPDPSEPDTESPPPSHLPPAPSESPPPRPPLLESPELPVCNQPTSPPELPDSTKRCEITFAEDSLTTSEEPRTTPVPPELSIQHELALAEEAGKTAASAATRRTGKLAPCGGLGGRVRCTGSPESAMGPDGDHGEPAAVEDTAGTDQPSTAGDDARVEQAERAIEEAERSRHRLLTDPGDNEVGNKYEHLYKILIIGELGTGKTSIIKRYVHQFFSAHYRATIGVDFALKVLHWDPNTIVRLQLWDIAGQERFGSMTRVYYKEAVAAFIVFDVTRSVTFDAIMKWKNDLDEKVQLPNGDSVPCVLLANKCDLPKEGMVTTPEKLTDWATQHGFLGWFETSAKENTGIEEAANFLVTKILAHEKSGNLATEGEDPEMLAVSDGQPASKGCSC